MKIFLRIGAMACYAMANIEFFTSRDYQAASFWVLIAIYILMVEARQ